MSKWLYMDLCFKRVLHDQETLIAEIYEIIRKSGEYLYQHLRLEHWKNPYPIEYIRSDCLKREVFIVRDKVSKQYVHTFQLEFCETESGNDSESRLAWIHKFATIPEFAGKGIGSKSMLFIESYCRNKNVTRIRLDVYTKSEYAIGFYQKRGFCIVGKRPTRNFEVYIMEKCIKSACD